ncbi:MAG: hypothetical protein RR189_02510, partial [Bacilli bacterium]
MDYGMNRVGLGDLGTALYYSIYFSIDKIIYLFVVAGCYGVLSITSGYQNLVTSIAKKLKGHEIVASVVISLIIVALTSLMSQTLSVIVFIPFFVSILSNMKIDKLSTFAITFGSILIGILGATYGTDSLLTFNNYLKTGITTGLVYRAIIVFVSFVLYNFFIVMRLRKVLNTKNQEKVEDPFEVEAPKGKSKKLPIIIVLSIVAIVIILGFVNWSANWNISWFTTFHNWLNGLKIGEDFTIFKFILGTNAKALGSFEITSIMIILVLASAFIAFMYRVKLTDYFNAFYKGIQKMVKPVLVFIGIYFVFVICYMSPFIPTITNWALTLTSSFNPYITSVVAFFTSMFHVDFGYTAYSVGSYLTATYASDLSIVHTIYTAMYGMVQLFLPTSMVLMIGLSLMNVDYKTWFKYIWLFVVGMLIILLVLFTV